MPTERQNPEIPFIHIIISRLLKIKIYTDHGVWDRAKEPFLHHSLLTRIVNSLIAL